MQKLRGVVSVTSGYAGGTTDNPTFYDVARDTTGHAEVVQVAFDPSVLSLETLLDVFFATHDPTSVNRQGHDVGSQYRSAVYYKNDAQRTVIEEYIQKLEHENVFQKKIVTEVAPLSQFYPAEAYHQNYYNQNKDTNPYCSAVIDPKLAKLRARFAPFLKEPGA